MYTFVSETVLQDTFLYLPWVRADELWTLVNIPRIFICPEFRLEWKPDLLLPF
jgi:hypothetical protein